MKNNNYYNFIVVILLLALGASFLAIYEAEMLIEEREARLTLVRRVEIIETEVEQIEEAIEKEELSEADLNRQMIRDYCKIYGYENPELAIAISRLETSNWKSVAFKEYCNWGGISRREVPLKYSDYCKGMEAFMQTLVWYQDDLKLTTPEEMQPKYCPANKQWAVSVRQIMEEEIAYATN